ncbi:isoaspartyl peptidase/L-asparaginase [uncultured Algimonas sp.]|uniref:isoaspartyl peptidase/L-asparaginase family protein n=1 Tax=uncultured Algimonas sp. TaxID=1547920 RepID=UPI0026397D61|nr:isoaspartyl peptidase/L-asparaginase [uncultured Algimonas sp.]
MLKYIAAALMLSAATPVFAQGSPACDAQETFAIIVHGGTSSGEVRQERLDFIETMLAERRADLADGASALDMVEAAIVAMEDSGLFNAGKAAITNAQGFVETDASIMDGRDLDAGAVASQLRIRNPIRAARLVMENTRHVMMVGDRGEAAVTALGAETVVPEEYFTRAIEKVKEPKEHGTVGAAVLDRCGDLAAGTSTGGYDSKIPGRVGDSPIIGAGVYAANGIMAGSATGHGEYFIRHTAIRSAAARMEYGGQSLTEAVRASIDTMDASGTGRDGRDGRGGIVAVDADGNFAAVHSTVGMIHGMASDEMAPTADMTNDYRGKP